MKILATKSYFLEVVENNDNTLTLNLLYTHVGNGVWRKQDGQPFGGAGSLIGSLGGVEKVIERCQEIDDIDAYVAARNESNKAMVAKAKDNSARKAEERRMKHEENYNKLFANDITETNADSVYVLLKYLNDINWGVWQLPTMTIGYSCHQYDCDGKQATTIKLDEPIKVGDEEGTMFQVGAPRGHLSHYRRIIPDNFDLA